MTKTTVSLYCVAKKNYGLYSVRPTWRTTSRGEAITDVLVDFTIVSAMRQGNGSVQLFSVSCPRWRN